MHVLLNVVFVCCSCVANRTNTMFLLTISVIAFKVEKLHVIEEHFSGALEHCVDRVMCCCLFAV